MATRIVYRVENKKTGKGPYTWMHKDSSECFVKPSDHTKTIFGTTSLKNIIYWIDEHMREETTLKGCHVAAYRVKRAKMLLQPRLKLPRKEYEKISRYEFRECVFDISAAEKISGMSFKKARQLA
jgi:hypothetical protein